MKLSRKKEKAVRKLLLEGVECNRIAEMVGIDHNTIRRVCDYMEIVNSMPEEFRIEIRRLLSAGSSLGAIETRLRVPRKNIHALLRSDKFHGLVTDKVETCKQCGAMMISPIPIECRPPERNKLNCDRATRDDIDALCSIIVDLLQLDDLQLIVNPLFHHIACRAERVYDRINKRTQTNATH